MLEKWENNFPAFEPVAHFLRTTFTDRWVRFHSLPDSKRYAETEAEYYLLLHRHNVVLETLALPDETLILLTTDFSNLAAPITPPEISPRANWWRTVHLDEERIWQIYSTEVLWRPNVFDPIIRLAADDVVGNVMITDENCRWIYHPYDGGMDLILDSTVSRDEMKEAFCQWLSRHPSGL